MTTWLSLVYNTLMLKKQPNPIAETFIGFVLAIVIAIPLTVLALDYFGVLTK